MIVITGDSWGCGEWTVINDIHYATMSRTHHVTHSGITEYLINDGYDVLNLSVGGASPLDILKQLNLIIQSQSQDTHFDIVKCPVDKIEKIFVFKTEWIRNLVDISGISGCSYIENMEFSEDTISRFNCAWYRRLSEIAQKLNTTIFIIGGVSDTIWIDRFQYEYPGCNIACQSFTNLIINNDHRIQEPVHAIVTSADHETDFGILLKKYKQHPQVLTFLYNEIEKSTERIRQHKKHPYFIDNCHPDRRGHKKLYDFLKSQNIL